MGAIFLGSMSWNSGGGTAVHVRSFSVNSFSQREHGLMLVLYSLYTCALNYVWLNSLGSVSIDFNRLWIIALKALCKAFCITCVWGTWGKGNKRVIVALQGACWTLWALWRRAACQLTTGQNESRRKSLSTYNGWKIDPGSIRCLHDHIPEKSGILVFRAWTSVPGSFTQKLCFVVFVMPANGAP